MFENFSVKELNVILYALGRYAEQERRTAASCNSSKCLERLASSCIESAEIADRLYMAIIDEQVKRNHFV